MFYAYIAKSCKTGKYYVGSCADIENRILGHNAGTTRSTKSGIPWKVIYSEGFESRSQAMKREKQIKSYHGGAAFKKLLASGEMPEWLKGTVC